jgi:hypothetical protein
LQANRFTNFSIELLIGDTAQLPPEPNYTHGLTAPTGEERAQGWQRILAPKEQLRDQIVEDLAERIGRVWVFEDPLSKKGDPVLQSSSDQRFFVEDRAYSFVKHGSSLEQATAALNTPPSWQYLGVQCAMPTPSSLVGGSSVNLDFLRALAKSALVIVTMVFDGEGYMLLRKI